MKTIEIRILVKMETSDEYSASWAVSRVESVARTMLNYEYELQHAIKRVEVESMKVADLPGRSAAPEGQATTPGTRQ